MSEKASLILNLALCCCCHVALQQHSALYSKYETGLKGLWDQSGRSNSLPSVRPDVLTGTGSDGPSEQRDKGQSHTVG